jgi:hypothetical protein
MADKWETTLQKFLNQIQDSYLPSKKQSVSNIGLMNDVVS